MYDFFLEEEYPVLGNLIKETIAEGTPFVVIRLPQRENSTGGLGLITPFEDKSDERIVCKVKPWQSSQWFDFSITRNSVPEHMCVCPSSTPENKYISNLENLIEILRERGGKTVIARNICGRFARFDIAGIFKAYLEIADCPQALTFLLWHPEMNFWMGSTPELILERLKDSDRYRTLALAGTHNSHEPQDWDIKDIEEHEIVARDIERRLAIAGLDSLRMPSRDMPYGKVVHLATEFLVGPTKYAADRHFFDSIVDELQPTPALGGYPRVCALSEIARFESWPRYLYAGCLNVADIRVNMTYGMIRCVHFDTEKWSVYTGSGVTALSNPRMEWTETERKAATLVDCLKQF